METNTTWIILVTTGGFLIILFFLIYWLIMKNKKKTNKYENSKKMNYKDFYKLEKDNIASTKNFGNYNSGLLIGSGVARKNKISALNPDSKYGYESDIEAYLLPEGHGIYFGSSGSGKTDNVIVPNILLNAHSKDKPSGVVFDPKGELYQKLAPYLRSVGYEVININLNETSKSHRWNPFQFALDSSIQYIKYALINSKINDNMVSKIVNSEKIEKKNSAFSSVEDTIRILIEIGSGSEKNVWSSNSKSLFLCAARALLEQISSIAYEKVINYQKYKNEKINNDNLSKIKDEIFNDQEFDSLIREEFLNFNLKNILELIMGTPKNNFLKFCENQGWNEYVGIFQSNDDQYGSFKIGISAAVEAIAGLDFEDLIATSDFKYDDFIDKSTIMFIDIPATAETKKTIAAIMVEQIYSFLSMKAKDCKGGALPRPFYFYLEELANIPKMNCVKTILTLGRGMRIFGMLIVQSIQQLEVMYGKEFLPICWDSTMVRVYLLAQDKEVLSRISDSFGQEIVKKDNGEEIQMNIITPEELAKIPIGTGLVMLSRKDPIYNKFASLENYEFYWAWLRKNMTDSKESSRDKGNRKIKKITSQEISNKSKIMNQIYTPENKLPKMQNFINESVENLINKKSNKIIPLFLKNLFFENSNKEIVEILQRLDSDFISYIDSIDNISDEDFYNKFLEKFIIYLKNNRRLINIEFTLFVNKVNKSINSNQKLNSELLKTYLNEEDKNKIWNLFCEKIEAHYDNEIKDIFFNFSKIKKNHQKNDTSDLKL